MLAGHIANAHWVIKHTNRTPRQDELSARDYFFENDEWFDRALESDGLLTYETYYGNRYAVARSELDRAGYAGLYVIVGGPPLALRFREVYPSTLLIFVAPSRIEVLVERHFAIAREETDCRRRMGAIESEIAYAPRFDLRIDTDRPVAESFALTRDALRKRFGTLS
jgi:guanylate kinase